MQKKSLPIVICSSMISVGQVRGLSAGELPMFKEGLHFVHQFVDVLELSVDGGKSDKGDLIEFF